MQMLKNRLKDCKLAGILSTLEPRLDYATSKSLSYIQFLDLLFEDEANSRRDNNLRKRFARAKFPADKTLENFDFTQSPSIDKRKINDAITCQFIETKQNIVFIGNPGTGKTHLSIAIGKAAIIKGYKVAFETVSDLLNKLHSAKADNSYNKKLQEYLSFDLLILDELGFKTLPSHASHDFFELISKCYEKRSLIITTNKGFELWNEIFADKIMSQAITDRILHHCTVFKISGQSFRTKHVQVETREIA